MQRAVIKKCIDLISRSWYAVGPDGGENAIGFTRIRMRGEGSPSARRVRAVAADSRCCALLDDARAFPGRESRRLKLLSQRID